MKRINYLLYAIIGLCAVCLLTLGINFLVSNGNSTPYKAIATRVIDGDTIDIIPGYYNNIIRVEMFGDEIERVKEINKITGEATDILDHYFIYPSKHFVIAEDKKERAIASIKRELEARLPELDMVEAHRLKQRTLYDIEMIEEVGYCKGIENYSRHFDMRKPGEKPFCLLDYFPEDFLMFIDESHRTIPQARSDRAGSPCEPSPAERRQAAPIPMLIVVTTSGEMVLLRLTKRPSNEASVLAHRVSPARAKPSPDPRSALAGAK